MSGSAAAALGLTNKEIAQEIDVLAGLMAPYLKNEEYDIGDVLGEHHFEFLGKSIEEHRFGTIQGATYEAGGFVTLFVKELRKEEPTKIVVRRERAASILFKMRDHKKYIDFIIRTYQKQLESVQ